MVHSNSVVVSEGYPRTVELMYLSERGVKSERVKEPHSFIIYPQKCPPQFGEFQSCVYLTNSLNCSHFTSIFCPFSVFMFSPRSLPYSFPFLTLTAFCPESTGRTHMNLLESKKSIVTKNGADETDMAADRIVNLTRKMGARNRRPPLSFSSRSVSAHHHHRFSFSHGIHFT